MYAMPKKSTINVSGPTEKIAPGHLVVNVSTSAGGLRYVREHQGEQREGERVETEYNTRKILDNEGIVRMIDKVVKEADYACRKHCVRTAFGYFASDEALELLQGEITQLQAQMSALNKRAQLAGSAHRGRIGVIAARLDLANPETMRECYRVIRETLEGVYEALRKGDVKDVKDASGDVSKRGALRPVLLRARNLEGMAVGMAGEAIKDALACAKDAKAQITSMIEDKGMTPEQAGQAVDLAPIETAIVWYSETAFGGGS